MDMNTYQTIASKTAVYPGRQSIVYPVLGLAGEAGEVAGKLSKHLRGDGPLDKDAMAMELGDCLWFIAAAGLDLGWTLEDIALQNVHKLQKREAEGTLKGNGDNR
jgi:NTP pyrophosphatase (non-canonical NTP hydrolase)